MVLHFIVLGDANVPVADCKQVQFESHPKHSMLFKDFLNYWEEKSNGTSKGAYASHSYISNQLNYLNV